MKWRTWSLSRICSRKTIPSFSLPDLDSLLGRITEDTNGCHAGGPGAFSHFRDLVNLLLSTTVMRSGGAVRLYYKDDSRERASLSGWTPLAPIHLNDNRYLRLGVSLYLDETDGFLKVETSSYQYQSDEAGERAIFRYDYLRDPGHHHPPAHLQIVGTLDEEDALPRGTPLERIHFPVQRTSIEAVIRLLAEEFRIECNSDAEIWRPVLAAAEDSWLPIAHRPLSGPRE